MRERPWIVANAMLLCWALFPEIRRLIDWKIGFNSISVISVVPLVALVPFAFPLLYTRRLARLDRGLRVCAWLWFGGFVFSLIVAFMQFNFFGGAYAFAEFCLPAIFGLWLATSDVPPRELYENIASFMLWLGTALAIYGVIQFVVAPAWDMDWLKATKLINVGVPEPFMFRPFSTLNSPGLFADFLTVTFLLNLPRLRRPSIVRLAQVGFVLGVLVLTMVRSDWVAVVVGMFAYIVLSPDRMRNLMVFAGIGIVCTLLVANASTLLGNSDAGRSLSARFETFTDLGADQSYDNRQAYFGATLTEAEQNPLGSGLGVLGTAAKLSGSGDTKDFDNGYIARFTEMGYFGTACYLAAVFGVTIVGFRRWRALRESHEVDARALAAGAIAVQAALMFLDISSDHHNSLPGLFFWMSMAMLPMTLTAFAASTAPPADAAPPRGKPARRFAS
jgi:hypothetical protein